MFKENFIQFAQENWTSIINGFKCHEEDIFHLVTNFYFPKEELINDRYGIDGRIKSRYKRLDVDNRKKLLQDSLCSVLGIDDTRIFSPGDAKFMSFEKRVEIYLMKVELKDYHE